MLPEGRSNYLLTKSSGFYYENRSHKISIEAKLLNQTSLLISFSHNHKKIPKS